MFSEEKNIFKRISLIIISILILLTFVIGISYASYKYTYLSNNNTLESGSLSLSYTGKSNEVLVNLMKNNNCFDFTLTNNDKLPYKIYIEKNQFENISDDKIKISLYDINSSLIYRASISDLSKFEFNSKEYYDLYSFKDKKVNSSYKVCLDVSKDVVNDFNYSVLVNARLGV